MKSKHINSGQIASAVLLFLVIFLTILYVLVALFLPRQGTNFRAARRMAGPLNKVTTRASEPAKFLFMEISAYSASVQECDAAPLITASGQRVRVGGIAADLRVLPFGSIVIIPNYNGGNPCIVTDTGSAIRGNKLDVFMWKTEDAMDWGRRRNVKVKVLYTPKER